jgi:propionyl-CoA carboxylase alpha chain
MPYIGYGFLSENADFAEKQKEITSFYRAQIEGYPYNGSKLAAKEAVKAYNIPMVPGLDEAITDIEKSQRGGYRNRFPILIKASAGGGGKGMRVVEMQRNLNRK